MKEKKWLKILSALLVFSLMTSLLPELNMLGMVIDFLGMDVLALMIQAQLITLLLTTFRGYIKPAFLFLAQKLEKVDPYFCISSCSQVRKCPALVTHALPFFLCFLFLLC